MDFTFAVKYTIERVNQNGLKLNGTHQLPLHVDDNIILGGSVHSVKGKRGFTSWCQETGLEIIADKTKYMVTSRYQNAGRGHNIKTDNSSC